MFSGTIGGGNWGGAAFNPQLGYLFVNTSNLATVGHMVPGTGLETYRNELSMRDSGTTTSIPVSSRPGESSRR